LLCARAGGAAQSAPGETRAARRARTALTTSNACRTTRRLPVAIIEPVVLAHGRPVGGAPRDVRQAATLGLTGEEAAPAEDGMLGAQPHDGPGELEHVLVDRWPVDPRGLVVLAVGVVIAVLGAADFVAVQDHRHALAEQKRGNHVAPLPRARRRDLRILRGCLDATVPCAVVLLAVVVYSPLASLCFLVVHNGVVQREAVVA